MGLKDRIHRAPLEQLGRGFTAPETQLPENRSCTSFFLHRLFTTTLVAMGTPRCFHRPRRWRQKQPQNETSEQGNMSPQAAPSQPSHYHPDTGSMDSPGRPVWHGGSPAGDGMPDPHLQTSQTAPAGWTGRWLQSLGQGESTVSQISQNSPSTSMHPNLFSLCISLPGWWGKHWGGKVITEHAAVLCLPQQGQEYPALQSQKGLVSEQPAQTIHYRQHLSRVLERVCKPTGIALPPSPPEVRGTGPATQVAGSTAALLAADTQPSILQPSHSPISLMKAFTMSLLLSLGWAGLRSG